MTNMMQSGSSWLRGVLETAASQPVELKRGSDNATANPIDAVVGSTRVESESGDGTTIRTRIRDYLIPSASYDFGAGAVEPAAGDEIRETIDGVVHVFTVLPLGANGECYRWWDRQKTTYRVHTSFDSTE